MHFASCILNYMSRVPPPLNDQNKSYLVGSPERAELKARLAQMAGERVDMPLVIGGQEIRTGRTERSVMPHDHRHVLGDWHVAEAAARQAGDRRGRAAARDWATLAVRGSRGRVPPRRGAADDDLARDAQRRDDARAVEDGVSGRDRRGVGADRLLALQSALRAGALRRAADQHATRCGTRSSTGRSRGSSTP